ncbi:hypothetical protein [Bacillus sp. B-jedd]|uniref:hypothetical protein n=1 Tax=Bacillus sp. B-jedd TaxID=1476857 RepID=UPI0005156575|nr:hypothetical protein [Bacillus sp. B-jedd]CEG28689.1 hypothetical protein BN1002_03612 [Bacillus sp. B-jedd]
MKGNNKLALIVSYIVLVGFPFFFLVVSMFTGQWGYFAWSIPPSLAAGLTGLMFTLNQNNAKEPSKHKQA